MTDNEIAREIVGAAIEVHKDGIKRYII